VLNDIPKLPLIRQQRKKMAKQCLNEKMDHLLVPRIQKMNSPMSPVTSDDEEGGLGYHHTLVSFEHFIGILLNS
jgi:hypothetical protein